MDPLSVFAVTLVGALIEEGLSEVEASQPALDGSLVSLGNQILDAEREFREKTAILWSEFGAAVRKARERRGLTLRVAAKQIGIAHGYLSLIESGNRYPSPDIMKISSVLEDPTGLVRFDQTRWIEERPLGRRNRTRYDR